MKEAKKRFGGLVTVLSKRLKHTCYKGIQRVNGVVIVGYRGLIDWFVVRHLTMISYQQNTNMIPKRFSLACSFQFQMEENGTDPAASICDTMIQ